MVDTYNEVESVRRFVGLRLSGPLSDFYADDKTELFGLPNAVMHTGFVITGEDFKQLEAIYLLHDPHWITRGLMMIRAMMLIPMLAAVLACGLLTPTDDPAAQVVEPHAAPAGGTADQSADPVPTTEDEERTVEVTGDVLAVHYGDTSIEEKIFDKNAIVKATMTSLSSEVFVDAKGKYRLALKFNLDVREYLKGSGPSSIVVVWTDGRRYDTNDEAENAKATTLTKRDDQWDDREAIIFLYDEASSLGASLDARLQLADHFFLALGHRYFDDDRYSLNSTRYKAWLPAASSTGSTGDDQEFLLDVPSASGSGSTDSDDHPRRPEDADRRGHLGARRRRRIGSVSRVCQNQARIRTTVPLFPRVARQGSVRQESARQRARVWTAGRHHPARAELVRHLPRHKGEDVDRRHGCGPVQCDAGRDDA